MKIIKLEEKDLVKFVDFYLDTFLPYLKIFGIKPSKKYIFDLNKLYLDAYELLICKERNKIIGAICFTEKPYRIWFSILKKVYWLRWLLHPFYFCLTILQRIRYMFLPHIFFLGVSKEKRKKGIGLKLVQEALTVLKKKNVKVVYLETLSKGDEIKFYKKLGFKEKEEIKESGVHWKLMYKEL